MSGPAGGAAAGADGAGTVASSFLGAVALSSSAPTPSTAPAAAPVDVPFASQVSEGEAAALLAAVDDAEAAAAAATREAALEAAKAAAEEAIMVAALEQAEQQPGMTFNASRRAVAQRRDKFWWLPGARRFASTAQRLLVQTEAADCRETLRRLRTKLLPAGSPAGANPYEELLSAAAAAGRARVGPAETCAAAIAEQAVWHSLDVLAEAEDPGRRTRAFGDLHCAWIFSEPVPADVDISGDGGLLRIEAGNFVEAVRAVAAGQMTTSTGRVFEVHPCVVTAACKKAPAPAETQAAVQAGQHGIVSGVGAASAEWHDLHRGGLFAGDPGRLRFIQLRRDENGPSGFLKSRLLHNVATQPVCQLLQPFLGNTRISC